jgi:glycine cleavage system H protein
VDPKKLRYTEEHEWIGEEDGLYAVGITEFAQEQLGDITYVELPEVGDELSAMEEAASIESVKAASDIYTPVSGLVAEINEELETRPELINKDCYGDGWIFKLEKVKSGEVSKLMDYNAYQKFLETQEH